MEPTKLWKKILLAYGKEEPEEFYRLGQEMKEHLTRGGSLPELTNEDSAFLIIYFLAVQKIVDKIKSFMLEEDNNGPNSDLERTDLGASR